MQDSFAKMKQAYFTAQSKMQDIMHVGNFDRHYRMSLVLAHSLVPC